MPPLGQSAIVSSTLFTKVKVSLIEVLITMTYIQRRGDGYLETVDEFITRKEARLMLLEYQIADPAARYYLSSRPTRSWTDA